MVGIMDIFDAEPSLSAPSRPKAPTRKERRPADFSEKSFVDIVRELTREGNYEGAARFYLEKLPWMLASGMNPKEKLNHLLYLPRLIQRGGNTKHGHQKLRRKIEDLKAMLLGLPVPRSGSFVELGCGAHDPLALASYFFLNGFEPNYALDLLPPRNEPYSAFSMYDIIANIYAFPERYCWLDVPPSNVINRMGAFDRASFEAGDFRTGADALKDKVRLLNENFVECSIPYGSVSLLASFAVLEHVDGIAAVCQRLFEVMKPGGIVYHMVDLADHRSYRGDRNYGPFRFLTEEIAPANMNRLRAPEIANAHRTAGFEILRDNRVLGQMPESVVENLLPHFRKMALNDISATRQHLVVRKPRH